MDIPAMREGLHESAKICRAPLNSSAVSARQSVCVHNNGKKKGHHLVFFLRMAPVK